MQTNLKQKILKEVFGHNSFREFQEEAIDTILNQQDLLMVLPTGGGKSLTYQLPSLMMSGVSVVISPLLALMQDQVSSLNAQNISAKMLSSMQNEQECGEIINLLLENKLKFLYLSPERLNTDFIYSLLQKIDLNFFVIDEAHCLSEWGHEFRADYKALSNLKKYFPNVSVATFTATATSHVKNDILTTLNLQNPKLIQGKIFRKNLNITVKHRINNGYEQLGSFLSNYADEAGIIYTFSRKKADDLAKHLSDIGYSARSYHAGLSTLERQNTYHMFISDRIKIVVATIAFGMGIDKSNIRFVVHMSLPKTIENYFQEMGRAGRDGDDSDVLLLFNSSDIAQQKVFIDDINDATYKSHLLDKLNSMYRYTSSQNCRHKYIANYFEDDIDDCDDRCDNCINKDFEKQDITNDCQKFLSTIYRTNQSFGKNYIIDILRGSKNQKILQNGHDTLSVYAIGANIGQKEWFVIFDRLLELEAIALGEFQTLKLTQLGIEILKGITKVDIKKERLQIKEPTIKKRFESDDYNHEAFEKLKALRAKIAKDDNIPAYIVFSDKTLKEIANTLPRNKEQMLEVNGVGPKKFESYGEMFLELISELKKEKRS